MKILIKLLCAVRFAIVGLGLVLFASPALANEAIQGPGDSEIILTIQRQLPAGITVSGLETLAQEAGGSAVKPVVSKRLKVDLVVEEDLFGQRAPEKHLNNVLIMKVLDAGISDEGYVITTSRLRGAAWETDVDWEVLPDIFKLHAKPRTQFSETAIVYRSPEHVKLETEHQERRLELLKAYAGEWVGHYSCGAGPKTRANINISLPEVWEQKEASFDERPPETLNATFTFADSWVRPRFNQGRYQGTFSVSLEDRTGNLRGKKWVNRPRGFEMVHPTLRTNGEQLSANLNFRNCQPFMLYRADNPPSSVKADLEKVNAAVSAFSVGDAASVIFNSAQGQHSAAVRIDKVGPGYIKGVISHGGIINTLFVNESERVETTFEVHFPNGRGSQFVNMEQRVRGSTIVPMHCHPVASILKEGEIRITASSGACNRLTVVLTP